MTSVFDRKENIVGKGENAGYQHFLLFPRCFQKAAFLGVVISRDCVVKSFKYSITCIKRPLEGSNESGLLQQVIVKCRFY